MILSEIRKTIRDRLINLKYKEWTEFSPDNAPEQNLDKLFHVQVKSGTGSPLNQHVLKLPNDVTITIWRRGNSKAVTSQDAGLAALQEVLCDLLSPAVRTKPAYRRIDLNSYSLDGIGPTNESVCKVTINLTVECVLEVTQSVT